MFYSLLLLVIFGRFKSKFKLLYNDEFVCFSPESFINIIGDHIYSYPMKGTISSKVKEAKKKILESEKETREHNTIVDLIRNDMSMNCLLYTSPSPRDKRQSRMPSSA